MVRVKQYPDTLYITRVTDGYQDAEGNWIDGFKEYLEFPCRFFPNTKGNIISTENGGNYYFRYQIALPKGTENIKVGDTYKRGDKEGVIAQFEIGQLHSLAWV